MKVQFTVKEPNPEYNKVPDNSLIAMYIENTYQGTVQGYVNLQSLREHGEAAAIVLVGNKLKFVELYKITVLED